MPMLDTSSESLRVADEWFGILYHQGRITAAEMLARMQRARRLIQAHHLATQVVDVNLKDLIVARVGRPRWRR